jgi:1-phosphofructokinase family hexose kinase
MIYTITPNPALDLGGKVDKIIADEKNYIYDEIRSAGGNGLNAARIARQLNIKVIATGFIGGATGEEIKNLLDLEKIKHNFVQIKNNTRINLTISNLNTNSQTRLSFPGAVIRREEFRGLKEICNKFLPQSIIVLGGSLPKGVTSKDIGLLVHKFREKGHFCIVDMPGPVMKDIISFCPSFIKPNLYEFQELTCSKVEDICGALPLARQLTEVIPLICVSSLEGGALLVTKKRAWFGKIPKVKVKSSVGAGDSMVGAISAILWKEKVQKTTPEKIDIFLDENGAKILQWALAAACATLVKPGITMSDRDSILKYYPKINIKQI